MIWYSHVNEDSTAEILNSNLANTLFCVVGSGERLIALLDSSNLKQVYAIDTNLDALHLLKLKLLALTEFDIIDYIGFFGVDQMAINKRVELFNICLEKMDTPSKLFWCEKKDLVKNGILFMGHYEQFISKIRPINKLLLGSAFFNIFQNDFSIFPTLRWRIVKALFSNKIIYKIFGNKDTSFVGQGADISLIPKAFQELIDSKKIANSFMAHLVFKGHLRDMNSENIPQSLRSNKLRNIQKRLRNKQIEIAYMHNDFLEVLENNISSLIDSNIFCSISDILSFENQEYVINCIKTLADCKNTIVEIVVRSYLKNHLNKLDIQKIELLGFEVENISHFEKTNMYKVHLIKRKCKN